MRDAGDHLIENWTVEYGDGSESEEVTVPHAWRQDVSPNIEGPVVYRTSVEVPKQPSKLRFRGVSYAAEIYLAGKFVRRHTGIWDAFDVPLDGHFGSRVEILVSVVKNGGETYPASDVASGFLPYVFHTFGGIYGEVQIVEADAPMDLPAATPSRIAVDGSRLFVDGAEFYPRGVLNWGWYPDLGHTNPPIETVRREVLAAKKLGFNLIKFCLWVPPHRYLEVMKEEGLEAWVELPIWNPSTDPSKQVQIARELEQIVRQYRRHDNILFWTIGCELGAKVSSDFRSNLTRRVKNLALAPLVKDSSGGAEQYGGDIREFGDFYDFHPYCDTQFYPRVLDDILPGPRTEMPLLLGEFNDADCHRDLAGLGNEIPFWASNLSELNAKGVRWQYDLPEVLQSNRFSLNPTRERHRPLMDSSREKTLFMRKTVTESVRARSAISGYVITGWRDTPISSSGFFDDWDLPRFSAAECASWNGPACLFLIPWRQIPWTNGGNRPGLVDSLNRFVGAISWKVGIHSESALHAGLVWRVVDSNGAVVAEGAESFQRVDPLRSAEIADIHWQCDRGGSYRLEVEFGQAANSWPIFVTEPLGEDDRALWSTDDPLDVLGFQSHSGNLRLATRDSKKLSAGLVILTSEGTEAKPFWREAAYEFRNSGFWNAVPFAEQWARLHAISPDRVIQTAWLDSIGVAYEVLMNRVDVRTYQEDPILVRAGDTFFTTLRPFGGLGIQLAGIPANPAGAAFVRAIGGILRA